MVELDISKLSEDETRLINVLLKLEIPSLELLLTRFPEDPYITKAIQLRQEAHMS